MIRLAIVVGIACLILFTAFTGNSDAIDPWNVQDTLTLPAGKLDAAHTLGQTFRSHFPRLRAIQVRWVGSDDFKSDPSGRITLHLRHSVSDTIDLATASIASVDVHNGDYSKFYFAPIENSAGQVLYFILDASAAAIRRGSISLWASGEDAYPDGQLFVDHQPTNQDLGFRAFYEPDALLGQALELVQKYLRTLLFAVFVVLLPGLLLLFVFQPRQFDIAIVALVFLTMVAIGVALLQIRDISAPLWVDSPVHASYIASIVDQARLPLDRFYHLGFHFVTAIVVRLAAPSVPEAMLIVGQLLTVQTGLSVFLLSRKLSGSALAGLASAAAVWFLSPTPAYFVTWGRYPLLLGSALLPIALLGAIALIEGDRLSIWTILFVAVTFVALAFSQIRLIVFYFVFIVVYVIGSWQAHQHGWNIRKPFYRIILVGSIGIGFGLLWFGALVSRGSSLQSILALNDAAPVIDLATAQAVMFSHHGIELFVLALIGLIWGLARRTFFATIVSSWYIGVALISLASQLIGGRPYLEPSLVILISFLPITLLVGDITRVAITKLRMAPAVGIALISLIGISGISDMVNVINPATILFFDADQKAMEWIKSNTPQDGKFLINSFAWFDSTYVPSDGGAWIPTFTGRSVDSFRAERTVEGIAQWMTERKISFVYLGRRAGILTESDFIFLPESFTCIYNRDGVQIYQLKNTSSLRLQTPAERREIVEGRHTNTLQFFQDLQISPV